MRQELVRLNANGATGAWSDLSLLYDKLVAAMNASDSTAIRANLLAIGDLAKHGVDDDRTWNRILRLIERRRRLVESQRKRIQELDLTVTRAQVVQFATLLLEAVTRNVADPTLLKIIADEFRAVTGRISGEGTVH
jgi:hypothetical protein